MCWNRELQSLSPGMLLKSNMTAFLTDDNPSITLQGSDNFVVPKDGNLCHMATSVTSVFGP